MIALALALGLAIQTPPPFAFRQIDAGLTQAAAEASGYIRRCTPARFGAVPITECAATPAVYEGGVAGEPISNLWLAFDGAGLVQFNMILNPGSVPAVRSAFTAKFGEPCEVTRSVVTNRLGASFPMESVVWCLADGRLTLSDRSDRNLDRAQAVFLADRLADAPAPAPVVDF